MQTNPGDAGASSPALAPALEPAAAAAGLSLSLSLHIVCQMRSSAMKSGRGQRILSQTSRSLCKAVQVRGAFLHLQSINCPVKVQGMRLTRNFFSQIQRDAAELIAALGSFYILWTSSGAPQG